MSLWLNFDLIKFASTRPNLILSFQTNRCLSKFLPQLHWLAEKNLYNLGDEYNRPHFCSIALISIIFYPEQRHRKFIYYNSFGCDKNQKPFNLMPCKCQNYWIRCICYALNGVENIRMTKTISKAKGFKSTMVLGVRSFFLNGIVLFSIGKFKYFCAPLRNFFFYRIFFCFSATFSPLNLQG